MKKKLAGYRVLPENLRAYWRQFCLVIGESNREGLEETPMRALKAWQFWTSGYSVDPASVLKTFADGAENYDELVFVGAIPFYSHCEHHLAPFFGVVHIGYIPDKRILGLSKFARLVEVFARRLQVQERMTQQIACALHDHLKPRAVGVCVRARHLCIESRGIQKPGTITYTQALHGLFKQDAAARSEFLRFVERSDAQATHP